MTTFIERASGKVLTLRRETHSAGLYTYTLIGADTQRNVGQICFRCREATRELTIGTVRVCGHLNEARSRNPNPGVGRLLMYLACRYSFVKGARKIDLHSLQSAAPFYRLMGMHHPVVANPMFGKLERSAHGKLQPAWLKVFEANFSSTRTGGSMLGEIRTVLACIEKKIKTQWEERAHHSSFLVL